MSTGPGPGHPLRIAVAESADALNRATRSAPRGSVVRMADLAAWFSMHIDLGVARQEDRIRLHAILDEYVMLRAMKEALDRAVAQNQQGDPTELARRVIGENKAQGYSIVYALAQQVIRDHQHTLVLQVEIAELRAKLESGE
jgi:hypothetical protein